ncbi:MAG: cytidylate kinase family protein [Desulfobacteraceae bacterium]|jgi:cytidylate kinase
MAIVTISRGTFSGGKAVAEGLAAHLGYPCIGREDIIRDAVRDFDVTESDINALMVKQSSFRQRAQRKRQACLNYFKAALLAKAEDGNIVYHGHAVQFLLGNIKGVLRVRINADNEYRIARAMQEHSIDRDQAIAKIAIDDKQSVKSTRLVYGIEWNDPMIHDVIFTLDTFTVPNVVSILSQMTELEAFTPDETSRQTFKNLQLQSLVWAALAKDKRTWAAGVQVEADKAHITVKGSVGSKHIRNEILAVVANVPGVKGVTSQMGIGSNWLW